MKHVQSVVENGQHGLLIEIECHMSNGLPSIVIVGYANKAVDEAKERIRGAFASTALTLPRKRITVNLAPADVPKDSSSFDLAIAVAILKASNQLPEMPEATIFIGELGLDGSVRPVRGVIGKVLAGKHNDITQFVVPKRNLNQAKLVPDVSIIAVETLKELCDHLTGSHIITPVKTHQNDPVESQVFQTDTHLYDVVGQEVGKRAIEISAAGGHNLLLGGPPGTGKTMLAKALPGLLPRLNRDEMLEITHLHSLASNNFDVIITSRPFRSPHHSASNVAIVGGGNNLRPGEISLSHRGVLLFDELPEFNRITVEALRQPLESRKITIARAKDAAEYPAHFIFVATANPCPCGHYGTSKPCRCLPHQIVQYRRKLSGPILDRIDLYADVHEIDNSLLLNDQQKQDDTSVKSRVAHSRATQAKRFNTTTKLNADMTNKDVKTLARLEPDAKTILDDAATRFELSARSYIRTVKVARTIADLDDSPVISKQHIAEALQYRPHQYHDK